MKRFFALLLAVLLLLGLCACAQPGDQTEEDPNGDAGNLPDDPSDSNTDSSGTDHDEKQETLTGKIAVVYDTSFLMINDTHGLLSVSFGKAAVYDEQGTVISSDELAAGMNVTIAHSGEIMERYPASPGAVTSIQITSREPDLIGFYSGVIADLLEVDEGLNAGITMLAFDLTNAGNLTQREKEALLYIAGNTYGVASFASTYDELSEAGYIDPETLGFEDGLLIKIAVTDSGNDSFTFDAEKWRGPLGAYFFSDCKAMCKDDQWDYTIGAEMIS